ncbi:MAG: recombinase family protein [Candidatus Cybelea sp.]
MQTSTVPRDAARARKALAWALCVVSSTGQEDTLPHQRAWAEETARRKGWRLLSAGIFEGVATGKDGPRRLVRDLLRKLRATEPDVRPSWLLMIRTDRLGRGDMVATQVVVQELHQLGVSVWTRDQGEMKVDTTMEQLYVAMQAAVAAQENDVRADKMRQVRKQKREAGLKMGTVPYGIRRVKGVDSPDPKRANVVKEAFSLRVQGKGYDPIGRRLTAIALPQEYLKGPRVVHWTPQRVKNLLRNHAYVEAGLIDEATFVQAQKVAKLLSYGRGKRRGYHWPLNGVLNCYCGRRLIGQHCGTKPWRYRYYMCKAHWNHDAKNRLVRAEPLETQFVALLDRLDASPALIKRYRQRAAAPVSSPVLERTIRDGKAKLADLSKRREKVWELHESGHVRAEDVQERLDKLTEQRDKLQSEVEEAKEQLAVAKGIAQGQQDAEDLLRRAVKIFQKANIDQQNEIAKATCLELGGFTVDAAKKLQVGRA